MMNTTNKLRALYLRYEEVRQSGLYNMLTEAGEARDASGLNEDEYDYVIQNYSYLKSL